MLDGVKMNIVRATFEVLVVAYCMFPKPPLPKQILATLVAGNGHAARDDAARELGFDRFPATGEI